jgi:hypothetical protein
MADDSLLLLAKEVRSKTLRLLEGVSDTDARWAPPKLNNNMVWHAGHSYVVVEHLSISSATAKPPQLPDGWFDLFSWKSKPTPQTQFPPVAEMVQHLRSQLDRALAAIEPLSAAKLAEVVDPTRGRTLRYNILHGLHDEAGHQGEIWLLKKLIAAQK